MTGRGAAVLFATAVLIGVALWVASTTELGGALLEMAHREQRACDGQFDLVARFVARLENGSPEKSGGAAMWTALSAAYFLEATAP